MNKIWRVGNIFERYMSLAVSRTDDDIPIFVSHNVDLSSSEPPEIGIYGGHLNTPHSPAATLIITHEDFGDDYFTWGGCMFVSERMRQAMAIDPSEIKFYEIDDSHSVPLSQSKRYQIMEPIVTDDVLDSEKSEYRMDRYSSTGDLRPIHVRKLALRPDATPAHELFYDKFFSWIVLCTDDFAQRVLEAGCTGVEFIDPHDYPDTNKRYRRTLNGVQEF